MKQSLFIFSFLFLSSYVGAKDYLPYYTDINNAERCFVNDKIDSSYFYYDRAFASYTFIFVKDAFIAAQISYKHNDIARTEKYLLIGADNGLMPDCIETAFIFQLFIHTKEYEDIKRNMLARHEDYLKHIDTAMQHEWYRRYTKEQKAKNSDYSGFKDAVLDNVHAIKKYLAKGMFPADRLMGIDNACELTNTYAFYTLAHYDCVVTELHDSLWNAVKNGYLHPRDFAALCEFDELRHNSVKKDKYINENCLGQAFHPIRFNMVWFHYTGKAAIEEAEANRVKYYLTGLETDKRKAELERKEGYQLFYGYR